MLRSEYPRPNFVREKWLNLNGEWDFAFSDEEYIKIVVPFVHATELSGINEDRRENIITYKRSFVIPKDWKNKDVKINFGAVDYRCWVYINGNMAGFHEGGHTPFSINITEYLNGEKEEVFVRVEDPQTDQSIPRGKQYWREQSEGIWYTPTTGIWQTVWLEPVEKIHFKWVRFTPDVDKGAVEIAYRLSHKPEEPISAEFHITVNDNALNTDARLKDIASFIDVKNTVEINDYEGKFKIEVTGNRYLAREALVWTPEKPILFDVNAQLFSDKKIFDEVYSYFGMRKVHVEDGKFYLNNQPYYQKLLLDQGYWEKGLLTAPSDEDFVKDIEMSKAMGFNGCRKHEKVEDPRFLYWADKLGFIVWGAMASCWVYSPEVTTRFTKEWIDAINRDYNHPSIVAWGMLNESWGVPDIMFDKSQQAYATSLYYLAHAMDGTRAVISNDGWEQTVTDICALHTYSHGDKNDKDQISRFENALESFENLENSTVLPRPAYAKGHHHKNTPVILTEVGGIQLDLDGKKGWGYTSTSSEEEYFDEIKRVLSTIMSCKDICGFCYTQTTDVEQEINGLLTYDRQFKVSPEKIKEILDTRYR